MNGPFDGIDRSVDMTISAGLKALRKYVILVMADVLTSFPQIIQRSM